jgi:hypothetical protein
MAPEPTMAILEKATDIDPNYTPHRPPEHNQIRVTPPPDHLQKLLQAERYFSSSNRILQGATEKTEASSIHRLFRTFTEGNEGNEEPIPANITRFVPLVTFCSKIRIEETIGLRSHTLRCLRYLL